MDRKFIYLSIMLHIISMLQKDDILDKTEKNSVFRVFFTGYQSRGYSYCILSRNPQPLDKLSLYCLQDGYSVKFAAGLRTFEDVYKPIVDEWALYDNSFAMPALIEERVNQWLQKN